MPRGQFDALRLELADGERVHVYGRPELYEQRGDFRLRALTIERFGLGAHLAALERLKAKLAAEGLFAAERKRPLPRLPRRIGLVTGNDAAAKRDVLTAIQARFPPAHVARRRDVRPGAARRAGIVDALRASARARRRRDRARARRRQLRGPAPVQRRAARARGRGLPGAGRLGGRARAGHAALRPRRRRPRVDADGRRQARRPRPLGAVELLDRARDGLARGARRTLERDAQRLERSPERLRAAPRLVLERQASASSGARAAQRAPALAVERKRAALE